MAGGENRAERQMARDLDDVQAFPLLTSEVGQAAGSRPSAPTPTVNGGSSIGQLAEMALRDILAVRPSTTDPQGIVAALNNAFTVAEVDGRETWAWTPRSYSVQADMGAVTGAQASIYSRAKAALDQAVPLLNGLYPLRADADIQDVDSMRAIVRSDLIELVNELGTVGGPRVQRVDALFDSLLGRDFTETDPAELSQVERNFREALLREDRNRPESEIRAVVRSLRETLRGAHLAENDPEQVTGLLGTIRDRFGLERVRVNTIDEEQNLTNYFILVDHVIALKLSWNAQRHYFDRRGEDVFLGTQLVQLSRELAVIVESVQEAEFVMDSVFLGPAERQTVMLAVDGSGRNQLSIDELLGWIERFAAEEAPRIIREAGKDGVESLRPTISRLQQLTNRAFEIAQARPAGSNPPRGFHTPRVERAMQELKTELERAESLVDQIRREPRPRVDFVEPTEAKCGDLVRLIVDGENFQRGITVRLNEAGRDKPARMEGRNVTYISDSEIKVTFDLRDPAAKPGTIWTLVAINPDGRSSTKEQALTIIEHDGSTSPTPTPPPSASPIPSPQPSASPSPRPSASPTPSPSPRPTGSPAPRGFRRGAVEFHDTDGDSAGQVTRFRANKPPEFSEQQHIGTLRVRFSQPLSAELVKAGEMDSHDWQGMVVRKEGAADPVPGQIHVDPKDLSALVFAIEGGLHFLEGTYHVTFSSDEKVATPALVAKDGTALDGAADGFAFVIDKD